MIGVLVNTIAVLIGSLIGLVVKKGIPEKLNSAVMTGIGLCTVYIGISGALKDENTIIMILAIVIGAVIGTLIDLDSFINRSAEKVGEKFSNSNGGSNSLARGLVTSFLLFCIGSMTIVGSLNAGFGDNQMLFTKSVLDFISSIVLSASLGAGVMMSAVLVFAFQGLIALLAGVLRPILSDFAVAELVSTGSVLIIGLGLNLLNITKIKVADYLPAIIVAPLLCMIYSVIF